MTKCSSSYGQEVSRHNVGIASGYYSMLKTLTLLALFNLNFHLMVDQTVVKFENSSVSMNHLYYPESL